MATDALDALVHDLAEDQQLIDDVVGAARADFPEVARLPWAESRRHVAALMAAGFAAFSHDSTEDPDFTSAFRFGAERAALGVPVAGLLSGVHAGRSRILEIAINRGRSAGIPYDVLLAALLKLDKFGTALEHHVIDGYRAAERDLDHDARADRIQVLRRLLLDEPDDGPALDPAQFGLAPAGRFHCVVSDAAEPGRVRAMEQTYARCGGVLAPVGGRLSGLTPRLPPTTRDEPGVLVVTTPAVRLAQAPDAYRLGVTALTAGLAGGAAGVRSVTDLAGETALAAQPLLAGFLSEDLLAGLDPGDPFHRDLVSTALAFLDRGQRLDRTATALHLHPNTVRYRLRRLHELTGFNDAGGAPVTETVRWWWALRTWLGQPG
ncbi:helix-turn-helix domain-containing protein [Actinoplanes sp. NPDC051411]|uniref:helix-turn-helix domain-containing protein n=1 Tax=Actinoplanes sp. NPDC051411 TaxID=3155522 RepID=UPI003416F562